jgi:hypothetical protein
MNLRILLLLAVLWGVGILPCVGEERLISEVRAEVGQINADLNTYKKRVKSLVGLSLEGSEATYYYDGETIRKITAKLYGETYNALNDLYFRGDTLVFAYQKLNRYDTQVGMQPPPKIVNSEEKRLYFSEGALAVLKMGKSLVAQDTIRWQEAEIEIVELADMLRAAFRE